MNRSFLVVGLAAALAGAACSNALSDASDSIVYVTVTAPANQPPVVQLRAELTLADSSQTELFPQTPSATPIPFEPAATFVLTLPSERTGSLGIGLAALDGSGTIVARGGNVVDLVPDGRADVTIALALVGKTDAGVPDTAPPKADTAPPKADAVTRTDAPGSSGGTGGALPGTGGRGGVGGSVIPSGTGGTTGGAGGAPGCSASLPDSAIAFCRGQARGAMTGWAWVAEGEDDVVTSPVCDNTANGGGDRDRITAANPCPAEGGMTVWSAPDALCLSGYLPRVIDDDYDPNWGIQIGWNTAEPTGSALGRAFAKVAFVWTGDVTPTNHGIRGEVHLAGDSDSVTYCANIRSGEFVPLTAFNTHCWDQTGTFLTADRVPKIDKMGVQISSDDLSEYTITDFCLTGVYFDQLPDAPATTGSSTGATAARELSGKTDATGAAAAVAGPATEAPVRGMPQPRRGRRCGQPHRPEPPAQKQTALNAPCPAR